MYGKEVEIGFSIAEAQEKIDEINYKVQMLDDMLNKEKLTQVHDFIVKFEEKSTVVVWLLWVYRGIGLVGFGIYATYIVIKTKPALPSYEYLNIKLGMDK